MLCSQPKHAVQSTRIAAQSAKTCCAVNLFSSRSGREQRGERDPNLENFPGPGPPGQCGHGPASGQQVQVGAIVQDRSCPGNDPRPQAARAMGRPERCKFVCRLTFVLLQVCSVALMKLIASQWAKIPYFRDHKALNEAKLRQVKLYSTLSQKLPSAGVATGSLICHYIWGSLICHTCLIH